MLGNAASRLWRWVGGTALAAPRMSAVGGENREMEGSGVQSTRCFMRPSVCGPWFQYPYKHTVKILVVKQALWVGKRRALTSGFCAIDNR